MIKEHAFLPISKKSSEYIKKCLTEHILSEDETITNSFTFAHGLVMDIKCCGCQDEPAYTEAVLFEPTDEHSTVLCEVGCTDCGDEYLGDWEIEYNGTIYQITVVEE